MSKIRLQRTTATTRNEMPATKPTPSGEANVPSLHVDDGDSRFLEYLKNLRAERRQTQQWLQRLQQETAQHSTNDRQDTVRRVEAKIADLDERISQANRNDEGFLEYLRATREVHEASRSHEEARLSQRQQEEMQKQQCMNRVRESERAERIFKKYSKANMEREYDYLLTRVEGTLPDYIKENLQRMPNNRGYIWRGAYYFGSQPLGRHDDPSHLVLFEKRRHETLIHETFYPHVKRIFRKNGKEQTLLSETLLTRRH